MPESITMDEIARRLQARPEIVREMLEDEPRYRIAREARLTQAQVSRLESGRAASLRSVARALDALGLELDVRPRRR